MSTHAPAASGHARLLALAGLGFWLLSGAAEVWEVLASQSPDSPWHLGVLAGPVAQLRNHSFGFGTLLTALAWLWPAWFSPGEGRLALAACLTGAGLETGALLWAAARGMLAVQAFDPRPDARLMLILRALGHVLWLLGGAAILLRGLRGARGAR
jgi:hypothetical protein